MNSPVDVSCLCGKCDSCVILNHSLCTAGSAEAMVQLNRISHRRTYPRGSIIQAQGEPVDLVGNVVEGVVKLSSMSVDGDSHVVGLLFPSDFFGRLFSDESRFSFEAATDVTLCAINRLALERFLADHPVVEHEMHKAKLDELDAVREWAAIINGHTTMQRVSTLIYVFSRRSENQFPKRGANEPPVIHVPLGRRDIADFLGTTPETLSRNIQTLSRSGIIRIIDSKHFELLDVSELIRCSGESREDLNRISAI